MKAVILAAGYATRMGTLALDRPKALLEVGGRPVLDYLMQSICTIPAIEEVFLVTNRKFAGHFQEWAAKRSAWGVRIIDDGTLSNEHRLGAIADLRLAIARGAGGDDLLVAASDNIFMLSFPHFIRFFEEHDSDCITVHVENDLSKLRKTGVVEMDTTGRVQSFEEKPAVPRSHFACPPLYLFKRETLGMVSEYLESEVNPDAPGYFIQWLTLRLPLHALVFDEPRYPIGDAESYRRACEIFIDR